ncbi:LysR family transcriptional regulator [Alcaligenes ammonioxydans]|uniref:LysR family transcriptional regulator n=1 Tax=Alcaligenes TaxID=507 RepID=UPI00075044D1|nr:LysR family transcriptional regulator [Alcaligenes ammonioxydans]MCH1879155.1 LysR family transcriptional regulator [Alcaligenes ammonioxydans]
MDHQRSSSPSLNRPLYDLDLLLALLTVVDCGSFTAAASRLHSTQSTISQKVRRLEELAGLRLLDRASRGVSTTEAGQTLLAYARQMLALNHQLSEALSGSLVTISVRLGVPEDFTNGQTMRALAGFNRRFPQVRLEVSSGLSSDLLAAYDQGELDLVLVKQRHNAREAVACLPEQTAWVDSATDPVFHLDPIPLVTFPRRGVYREEIISAVESLGRRWRISFTSSSLSGIQGAVADGMGISLLPRRAVRQDHIELGQAQGLPRIDAFELAILHRPHANEMVTALSRVLVEMLAPESARRTS